jgi:hypothetical protein
MFMSSKPWSLVACGAAALIQTVSPAASALSCQERGVRAPALDATAVPTNTRIWCPTYYDVAQTDVELVDPQGQQVSGTQTLLSFGGNLMAVFRPDAELAPQTQYQVICPQFRDWTHSFTTGSGPSQAPPELPSLQQISVRAIPDDGWGAGLFARFSAVSPANTIVVLDLNGGAQLDASAPSGRLTDAQLMQSADSVLSVGKAPCLSNWPQAALGASAQIRLGAFDLTGAFSGWTESITATLPEKFEGEPSLAQPESDPLAPLPTTPVAPDPAPSATTDSPLAAVPPVTDVVATDLASDGATTPSSSGRSSSCQLGASAGGGSLAGLLVALACMVTRRRRPR